MRCGSKEFRLSASLLRLDAYQPVRRLREDGKCRKLAPHHGNFVAVVKPGTNVAVLVNFVGKIFAPRHLESLPRKEFRSPREQADAIHPMPLGFGHQSLHQPAAATLPLRARSYRDRTNFGQVRAIKMQRAASNDAAFFFQNHKVSYVLANLRQSARQQRAVAGIGRRSARESASHPAKWLYACAWRLTSSRNASIFFLAAPIPCRTRAGAVPPATSWIANTEAGFRQSRKLSSNTGFRARSSSSVKS